MKKIFLIILICLLCLGLAVGASCITKREFREASAIIRQNIYPAQLTTTFALRINPVLLFFGNMIVKMMEEEPQISQYIRHIRNIQVGIYDIEWDSSLSPIILPPETDQQLSELGWEPFVRVRQPGQNISLFYKYDNEEITGFYGIVLHHEQLITVEVQGYIGRLIQKAIQQYHSS